jgi:cysteine desulfurase
MLPQTTYLDHNATTPMRPAVCEIMQQIQAFPGNASSVHKAGRAARRLIEDSRQTLITALNAGTRDVIVFTSGATEANNMVLKGSGMERIIVSAIEHPSVLHAAAEKIPVLPSGVIDLAALDQMLEGNTKQTLISVMMVNNETGIIQPIEEVVAIARKRGALVHTDAVQAFGRMPVDIQKLGVDFLTLSSHKIGGPQGVGCLVIANCVVVAPLLHGGNQEKNLRAGTENLAGIVGFAKAVEIADIDAYQKLSVWRDKIEAALSATASIRIFGKESKRIANTTMFALSGTSSETQLIALDLAGICVSNGSACASGTVKASHVLKAMGIPASEAESSLRISLGWNTTEKDVDYFISSWTEMQTRIKGRQAHA